MAEEPIITDLTEPTQGYRGVFREFLSLFLRHRLAAWLATFSIIVAGTLGLLGLHSQFLPSTESPNISVSFKWDGASPADASSAILEKVEPPLRRLEGVDQTKAYAREGNASLQVEFLDGTDMEQALNDVETTLDGISDLPQDAEDPKVTRSRWRDNVGNIIISGPFSEASLATYATDIGDELLKRGIDRVNYSGKRDREIRVEASLGKIRQLGLSIDKIAQRIGAVNKDAPIGAIEGGLSQQIRYLGQKKTAEEIADLPITSLSDGTVIRLRDVASVSETYVGSGTRLFINGAPAVRITAERSIATDAIAAFNIMETLVEEMKASLPETLRVEITGTRTEIIIERLNLLARNGAIGFLLVCLVLFLFLNWKIAIWVAFGIPVSLLATFLYMNITGQTINAVSLVGLLMVLGIVAHDSIVVGEHVATLHQSGMTPGRAAERAVHRMGINVLAATLTTLAAFAVIFLITGPFGQILAAIPFVVMVALLASTSECLLMLPAHLKHTLNAFGGGKAQSGMGKPSRLNPARYVQAGFEFFREYMLGPVIGLSLRWRYVTVVFFVLVLTISVTYFTSGQIRFSLFPRPEAENFTANATFTPGLDEHKIIAGLRQIEAAILAEEKNIIGAGEPVIQRIQTNLGVNNVGRGDHLARMRVNLTPSEDREIRTAEITRAMGKLKPSVAGLEELSVSSRFGGPRGSDVEINLYGADLRELKLISLKLQENLERYQGVSGISDNLPWGEDELLISLNDRGRALGLTSEDLSRQMRGIYEGRTAQKLAVGEEDISVRVTLSDEEKTVAALHNIPIALPNGEFVTLSDIATIGERRAFSVIVRRDGEVSITVTADVDVKVSSSEEVLNTLRENDLQNLQSTYKFRYDFLGRSADRKRAFKDLALGSILALLTIFIIMALVFDSFFKPLAILITLPFAAIGVIWGHVLFGVSLSLFSGICMLALLGLGANDGIILVDQMLERKARGENSAAAAMGAAKDRLRALTLSLLTDFGGMIPLLFSQSLHVQFLRPVAITLVFGLAASTLLTLFMLPSLLCIFDDISLFVRRYSKNVALFSRNNREREAI